MERLIRTFGLGIAVAISLLTAGQFLTACPFCPAGNRTLSEEIDSIDVVAVARLVAAQNDDSPASDVPVAKFEIAEAIKGGSHVKGNRFLETIYAGDAAPGTSFLIVGSDPPELVWSSPRQLSARSRRYIDRIMELPAEAHGRLVFFQEYLEDKELLLGEDAFNEFARAPYVDVKRLKDDMHHDRLLAWIRSPDIPATHRRLYFTMLGVCGTRADLPLLESMMMSDERQQKAGLDAMIACYLTLKGAAGLPLIESHFLKNDQIDYIETYSAIMALRFHATEGGVIAKDRVAAALRLVLDRPDLADLVIPDLAAAEDWSIVDKATELFVQADESTSYVRVPVIRYLNACPLPKAKKAVEHLKTIDAAAVEQASLFSQPSPEPEMPQDN